MHIKQFKSVRVRVSDPMRPGRRSTEERLIPTGASSISHQGQSFAADSEGWFDRPADVGAFLLGFRTPDGSRFYTPEAVDEQVRLGAIHDDSPSEDLAPRPRRARVSA